MSSILNQSFTSIGSRNKSSTSSPNITHNFLPPIQNLPNSIKHLPQNLFVKNPSKDDLLSIFSSQPMKPIDPTKRNPKIVDVHVSTAVELEGKQIEKIARKMRKLTGKKELRMEICVDPSLIAGFLIRYKDDDVNGDEEGGKAIDLSVKGQLENLADRIEIFNKMDEQKRNRGSTMKIL